MFIHLPVVQSQRLIIIVSFVIVVFSAAAIFTSTVQAGTTCGGWHDTGSCCDSWWPGKQDWQENHCANCTTSGCVTYTNFRCNTYSQCP
jgi:hypothetical protein